MKITKKVFAFLLACTILETITGCGNGVKIQSVSLGSFHSAAITTDGCLYVWGRNEAGQVGDGTRVDRSTPQKIMDDVVSVSLGKEHSAAITSDGSLYMWGANEYGELGVETTETVQSVLSISSTPIKVMDDVKSVSLGLYHSAAITTDGSLYLWGRNDYSQLGTHTTEHNINNESMSTTPIKIMENVVSVSLGGYHSAAITTDGSLYMWGYNEHGQLGTEDANWGWNFTPIKVMDNVKSVSLGVDFSAAITTDGSLYTWGYNNKGQLGATTDERDPSGGTRSSFPIKIMDDVTSVSLGDEFSAAITVDGSLYTWGRNLYGVLGNGSIEDVNIEEPTKIMDNVTYVALGHLHTSSAITTDGSLYTCGSNSYGELGRRTDNNYNGDPIKINKYFSK